MATTASIHAHAAPQGFIRKYIFSLDHKVIGLQYYFLALTAVFVGMFLSLLMRIHLIWPNITLPLLGDIKPSSGRVMFGQIRWMRISSDKNMPTNTAVSARK